MVKKNIYFKIMITISMLLVQTLVQAQVGINTDKPRLTLDVRKSNMPVLTPEGLIPPRLSGNFLASKDIYYTERQRGAMVYVTSAPNPTTPKTEKITSPGHYYFDGTAWQAFRPQSNIRELFSGVITIPPHSQGNNGVPDFTDHSNTEYDRDNWWVISKTSTAPVVGIPFTAPMLTVEYEYQEQAFSEGTFAIGTPGNNTLSNEILDANTVRIYTLEGKTRLVINYIRRDAIQGWNNTLLLNLLLINTN